VTLNVEFSFKPKPLTFVPNVTEAAACGCTMAMLKFRVETPHEISRTLVSEEYPRDCDPTPLFVGSRHEISMNIRPGAAFMHGDGAVVLKICTGASELTAKDPGGLSADFEREPRLRDSSTREIRGHVRLHPERFEIDWLHGHKQGRSEDLYNFRRDAGVLLTALIHQAQRSRKLNQRIPPPAISVAGNRLSRALSSVRARMRSIVFRHARDA
jgi:hypothetical protein